MLFSGIPQFGIRARVLGKTGSSLVSARPLEPRLAPFAHAWLGHRALLTTVAAQRRAVDRNLYDNVDSTVPDGYSVYTPQTYVRDGAEPETSADGSLGGARPTLQPGEPSIPLQAGIGTSPEDWLYEPQASPSSRLQQQQPVDRIWAASGSTGPLGRDRDGDGRIYGAPAQPLDRSAAAPEWDQPSSPDLPPLRPAAVADDPQVPPSGPSQAQRYSATAADWGEVDPLLDWGGVAYRELSGWDEPDGNDSFASPSPSSRAMEDGSPDPAGGVGRGPGVDDINVMGRMASSSGTAAGGGSGTDWQRKGPDWHGRDSYGAPPSGSGAGTWFLQDERYGAGPAGGGATAATAGMGGTSPPPYTFKPSDIVLLPGRDASAILPLAPMSGQVDFFQPRTLQERIIQLVGSIGTSVILSKAAVLAGPALLYPIWSPWIRAGFRNLDLYSKNFACVGLWRAEVLDVQINGLAIGGMLISKQAPVVALLVGDPWSGGARVALELPYQLRSETIRVGDTVELLVLSRDDRFTSFKVVREVYLPQSGLWLYDYPYVNRDLFVAVSVGVERQRRAAAAASAAAQYYTYDILAGADMAQSQGAGPNPDSSI